MYLLKTELNLPMSEAITRLARALTEEGLGIVSDIDIQSIVTSKLHEEFRPYRILGACAPGLAKSLIGVDADIGSLLPCNIVVQEHAGRSQISLMDPSAVLGLLQRPAINDIALQVRNAMERVISRL